MNELNLLYGYLWWINNGKEHGELLTSVNVDKAMHLESMLKWTVAIECAKQVGQVIMCKYY